MVLSQWLLEVTIMFIDVKHKVLYIRWNAHQETIQLHQALVSCAGVKYSNCIILVS